jgi:concentrative nucleoside transporter, CNT family
MDVARGLMGMSVLVGFAWILSTDRKRFPVKIVIVGLSLQWLLGLIVLKTDIGKAIFDAIGSVVAVILLGADAGANFVFGELAGDHPSVAWKAIVGIKIMTTIIVVATLSAVGYHFGLLQRVVSAMAVVMRRTMGISGAESLAGAANVFLGQTEAPLLVRPYISSMTQSELMALMTGGFATVAAGVMAVYVSLLAGDDPESAVRVARHLLTACLMSAPAAFVMAKVMVPETGEPKTRGQVKLSVDSDTTSVIDAVTQGASQGMKLSINVLAMLIAFVALIAVFDALLIRVGQWSPMLPMVRWMGLEQLDLDGVLGIAFSPIAWLVGIDPADCRAYGGLLGKAMATNELLAYDDLRAMIASGQISEKTSLMATYSLCGFANISSIGIQIGGIGGLAPDRRKDLVRLGPRAMLGGAFACWMTGSIAGILA